MKNEKDSNETHLQLQQVMKKEIGTMREILANMHQEELSLLLGDKASLYQVMDERSKLLGFLSSLRLNRLEMSKKLQAFDDHHLDEIIWSETLSLRDQIMALVERMNMQHSRNAFVEKQNHYRLEIPTHSLEKTKAVAKKRINLATYPPKD